MIGIIIKIIIDMPVLQLLLALVWSLVFITFLVISCQTPSNQEKAWKICERGAKLGATLLWWLLCQGVKIGRKLVVWAVCSGANIVAKQWRWLGSGEIQIGNRKIDSSVPLSKQKCILLNVDDDTISKRVAMPCGHAITPDGLAEFVCAEIKKQKMKIICPMQDCGTEWKVSDIVKRGLTAKEREHLETGLTKNTLYKEGCTKECLRCSAYIQRDGKGTRLSCPICKQKGTEYEFCWTCQNEWQNKNDFRNCGNPSCDPNAEFQKILNTCSTKNLYGVQVPQVRACPNCNKGINHKEYCKHMLCPSCSTRFCYICLSVYNGRWSCGSYNTPCELAPRQKVVTETSLDKK